MREPAHGLGEQPRAMARRGRRLPDLGISAPFGLCTHIGVGVRRDRFSKAQPLRRRWETAHPRQATHGARPGFAYSERDIPGRFGYAAESRCAAAAGSRIVGIPRICGRLSADSHAQEAPRDPRGCSDSSTISSCVSCAWRAPIRRLESALRKGGQGARLSLPVYCSVRAGSHQSGRAATSKKKCAVQNCIVTPVGPISSAHSLSARHPHLAWPQTHAPGAGVVDGAAPSAVPASRAASPPDNRHVGRDGSMP